MELPYNGRATITDNFDQLQIVIPSKKNYFITAFLGFWLCGWLVGEIVALTQVAKITQVNSDNIPELFIVVWLCGWTVGGIFAIRTFLWMIAGKEIITISQGVLSVSRKYALFVRPKSYDLQEAKNFRVQEDPSAFKQRGAPVGKAHLILPTRALSGLITACKP